MKEACLEFQSENGCEDFLVKFTVNVFGYESKIGEIAKKLEEHHGKYAFFKFLSPSTLDQSHLQYQRRPP